MRAGLAIAIFLSGTAAACAADMPIAPGGYTHYYSGGGVRAGQITIYDSEPGVVVRAYWRSPWRGRHYFPSNGEQPIRGRHEDLSSSGPLPEPAETFQRSWSTMPNYPVDKVHIDARPFDEPQPPEERFQK